jgi:peroxiredoxin family protein
MHQNIRKGLYFMNSSSSGEYLIFFVFYAYVKLKKRKEKKVQSAQLFEVKFGANSGYYQQNSFPHQI